MSQNSHSGHHHDHDHDHDHDHGHDHHAPPQPDDKVHSYYQILGIALKELLIDQQLQNQTMVHKLPKRLLEPKFIGT